jgi:hypothetical protein
MLFGLLSWALAGDGERVNGAWLTSAVGNVLISGFLKTSDEAMVWTGLLVRVNLVG